MGEPLQLGMVMTSSRTVRVRAAQDRALRLTSNSRLLPTVRVCVCVCACVCACVCSDSLQCACVCVCVDHLTYRTLVNLDLQDREAPSSLSR